MIAEPAYVPLRLRPVTLREARAYIAAHHRPDEYRAFPRPGSRGTWDMVERCERAGVRGRVVP